MEFEKHNNITFVGSQEVYAQEEDLSFEADQENLNTSTSSDRFATPSAKLIYDSLSSKKQPSQNVRQSLFANHHLDPLNESNTQNTSQQVATNLNNAFDNSMSFNDKTVIMNNNQHNNYSTTTTTLNEIGETTSIANKSSTQLFDDHAMDLSNHNNHQNSNLNDRSSSQFIVDQLKDELKNEKEQNETMKDEIKKLRNYVEQLNDLNKNLSEAILTVQDKFESSLNEKNAIIQDLQLQNNVITKERKLAVEDVQGLENSFSELHRRYEKLKLTLESCKKKEELFQEECLAFSEKLEESQRLNNDYKQRLEILENEKNNIVDTVKRQTEKELVSLRAQLKKAEMRFTGVQNQLEQKTQENLELNKMVDELTK